MGANGKLAPLSREENISSRMNKQCRVRESLVRCQQILGALLIFCACKCHLSILRHGLRLICIKSYNDHNFVKIYQNLQKFGDLGKSGNLNFPVT